MHYEDLPDEIDSLFNPEWEEGHREWPHERLLKKHGLTFKFMETWNWEGSTSHPNSRIWPAGRAGGDDLTRSMDIPFGLFMSALRVFGDSLVTYRNFKGEPSVLRFYPPIILTFWSAFEAFVRHTSELMIHTSKGIPDPIVHFLRDKMVRVNKSGDTDFEARYRPVLDRYAVLLRFGFGLKVDRGSKHWQAMEKAKKLRDYYTHIDAMTSRSISTGEVLEFLESVLLGIIWPSSQAQRTLLLGIHDIYDVWASLSDLAQEYLPQGHVEQPGFHALLSGDRTHMFYCPFINVDEELFPNSRQQFEQLKKNIPSS